MTYRAPDDSEKKREDLADAHEAKAFRDALSPKRSLLAGARKLGLGLSIGCAVAMGAFGFVMAGLLIVLFVVLWSTPKPSNDPEPDCITITIGDASKQISTPSAYKQRTHSCPDDPKPEQER